MAEEMKLELELISETLVKPSCPTPDHLRCHQLSGIDQMMVTTYMPLILYFSRDNHPTNNEERCHHIKRSLSEALTMFYPVAGRLRGNKYVECNDEGVHFAEAKAKCAIQDIIRNPNCFNINKLLPFGIRHESDLVAFFQVTHFDCGGMTIAFAMSHKLGDGLSSFKFLQSWAAIARGDDNKFVPRLISDKFFPSISIPDIDGGFELTSDNVVTKMFVFTSSRIATLRDKYADSNGTEKLIRPTRIEALTAFIWKKFITNVRIEAGKTLVAIHPVNLRQKMNPPLSEQHFGNLIDLPGVAALDSNAQTCQGFIRTMRDSIRKVDADYVKSLQVEDAYYYVINERDRKVKKGKVVPFNFTSLCRFPIYDNDFGWGKPSWVSMARWYRGNFVAFFDAKEGGAIEAWVMLTKEEMAKFEADSEIAALDKFPNDCRTCS
ncbi:hypothetical protein K2173_000680 [Erythroxylum novogranatense]|uniref:Vinorine synthase-like n=1 Tax=Erythroxylum novogranatense TaxID=1862640 RepID=A0AAV8SIW8_9ROSI|nr:hypothetical protein K2173_000680 [Erythroxylum novogranatense]